MGGLTKTLFGGGGGKNESGNKNYELLTGSMMPSVGLGSNALSQIGSLLGIGGGGGGSQPMFMGSTSGRGIGGGGGSGGSATYASPVRSFGNGTGGGDAEGAFQNYLNSTGHQFRMSQGMKSITGSNAARGLLNSGATLKALQEFGQNLGTGDFNNYLQQLAGVVQAGQSAANTVAGVGQYSKGKSSQQGGIIPGLFG